MSKAAEDMRDSGGDVCQACGACCAYSREWPRFSLETDAELEAIPAALVADKLSGMRCEGERCSALHGRIGEFTRCTIYSVRPQVCRSCMPGDDACVIARAHFRLYEMPRSHSAGSDRNPPSSSQERLQETPR